MQTKFLTHSFVALLVLFIPTAHADTPKSIQDMAEILLTMENRPNDEQRSLLEEIAESRSDTLNIQNMAKAMVNMEGKVRPNDKKLLWQVLQGINTGESEKELAKLITAFDTKASKTQAKRLSRLLSAQ